MNLLRSDIFLSDVQTQANYYCDKAGPELAERYVGAVEATIGLIAQHPKLGPPGRFRHERLRNWRFFLVSRPFNKHIIFYELTQGAVILRRVMDGRRDLSARLLDFD